MHITRNAMLHLDRWRNVQENVDGSLFDLSARQICRRIDVATKAAGLGEMGAASIPPRVGMAQDMAASEVSSAALMQAGRWKMSTSAVRYTKRIDAARGAVAQ